MKIRLRREEYEEKYVWARLGDTGEYVKFISPYEAGEYVGSSLPPGIKTFHFRYRSAGVEIPPYFTGLNYISLFWGDEEGQWIRDLTSAENIRFEHGVREGAL